MHNVGVIDAITRRINPKQQRQSSVKHGGKYDVQTWHTSTVINARTGDTIDVKRKLRNRHKKRYDVLWWWRGRYSELRD